MGPAGRPKVHKEVAEYGRRLVRNGWTELDEDPVGNPRYGRSGSPAVLTLARNGHGRWRQNADKLVAAVTGRKTGSTLANQARSKLLAEAGSEVAAQARIEAAARRNTAERRRHLLMDSEQNFNMYRDLMSRAPGK